MEISAVLIGLLLLVVALFFVSLPFQPKRRLSLNAAKADTLQQDRREAVLSALRALDFDFKTGKVGEEDYTPLRAQLMTEAAQYIEQEKQEEEKLEALIQTRRTSKEATLHCEHCDTPLEAGQHFCSKCGSIVKQNTCPSCGKELHASDQFCSSCGIRLGGVAEAVVPS